MEPTLSFSDYDPILWLSQNSGALAVVTQTVGPSYRPVGAMMAIGENGTLIGSLSSGCIEADIVTQALEHTEPGQTRKVKYGEGSPFMDLILPCGGGLEIGIIRRPDTSVISRLADAITHRQGTQLCIDFETHQILDEAFAAAQNTTHIALPPSLQFLVFGKGPEASTFATLSHFAKFPTNLISPDQETLATADAFGIETNHITGANFPETLAVDNRTAVVLFFHDHDWEPPLLKAALETPAFYIGAQGSQKARALRTLELQTLCVTQADLARLKGPIGLIPSARDARTLAVSVLAEILDCARTL